MKQKHSWEITDEFWIIAEPLVPKKIRDPDKAFLRKQGEAAHQWNPEWPLKPFPL
jgi:hypothetical protein